MAPIGEGDSTWGKYGAFLNSLHPEVKRLIQGLERIKDKLDGNEVAFLLD